MDDVQVVFGPKYERRLGFHSLRAGHCKQLECPPVPYPAVSRGLLPFDLICLVCIHCFYRMIDSR